ncbi:calcium homeostasis modulator protein 6-like [Oculina patagonica]
MATAGVSSMGVSTSSSSTSVSDFIASVLRVIENIIRQICHRIDKNGISALLKTALLFVALFAVKENLKHAFGYNCPAENYYFYANLYIYGPAVFFLCFAFVFSRPFWEFVTGCCRLSCNKRLLASPRSAIDIYLAISAPFLWIACAFTEGDYYVCALYGPESYEDQEKAVRNAESRSRVIAWVIILCWAVTSAIVVSIHRCCFRNADPKSQGYVTV